MTTIAIIQARLNSTRFPRKILAPMPDGRPMLAHVVERAQQIQGVDEVVVACPLADAFQVERELPEGTVIYAAQSEDDDVLGRYYYAAEYYGADVALRLTGDCPFLDPHVCEYVLERFLQAGADYATNDTLTTGYPDGYDVQICTRALLERLDREIVDPYNREHVFTSIPRDVHQLLIHPPIGVTYPDVKLSIDTPEDLERLTRDEIVSSYSWDKTET